MPKKVKNEFSFSAILKMKKEGSGEGKGRTSKTGKPEK